MELVTPIETICRLILRAREMEAQDADVDTDDEVDAADSEDEFAILDDESNEAVEEEIFALLDELGDEQVEEILALAWVGRGTYDASEWSDALEAAREPDQEEPIDQIIEMPTLAAYLDAGLAAFDLNCDGVNAAD
jgi:hypothetical protein